MQTVPIVAKLMKIPLDLAGKLKVWCCLTHRYEKRRSANKLISELAAANSYAS